METEYFNFNEPNRWLRIESGSKIRICSDDVNVRRIHWVRESPGTRECSGGMCGMCALGERPITRYIFQVADFNDNGRVKNVSVGSQLYRAMISSVGENLDRVKDFTFHISRGEDGRYEVDCEVKKCEPEEDPLPEVLRYNFQGLVNIKKVKDALSYMEREIDSDKDEWSNLEHKLYINVFRAMAEKRCRQMSKCAAEVLRMEDFDFDC